MVTLLTTEFSENEKKIINIWNDENLIILKSIENTCYLLNMKGNISFSECFGSTLNNVEKKQKYFLAVPNKIIKYYHYYLLENKNEEGTWYVGEKSSNGNIEFYKCCESLEEAFQSL